MPSLDQHQSNKFVKVLYIGDSGTGKTGSLVSLVQAGYKLRILDFDNGLDSLKEWVKKECPDKISSIGYVTVRDKIKSTPGGPRIADPQAFHTGLKLMDKWEDGTTPSEWGEEYIFVMDTMSAFGKAAFAWSRGMNPTAKEPRTWYFGAQQGVEDAIGLLTGEEFKTNVIVISHVRYSEATEGMTKGFANSIGAALGPIIPRYFNSMILAETSGAGRNRSRTIRTVPTNIIDLKTPAPFKIDETLPLGTGMSTIFSKLKEL